MVVDPAREHELRANAARREWLRRGMKARKKQLWQPLRLELQGPTTDYVLAESATPNGDLYLVAAARYREVAPEWNAPWDVGALGEERFDLLSETLAELPCPALDATGTCQIYAYRPATCRLMGLSLVTPEGDLLENACPIQSDFPAYESLPPTPFDLLRFEYEAEEVDERVTAAGWCVTTIAAAIVK
jgi:Fe-S-cluster containining protein